MLCAILWACGEPAAPPAAEADRPPADPARQQVVDFWRVYQQATRLRVAGDVAAALVHYDSALARNPDHGDALYHSGGAAFQLGYFAEAESRWRRLLAVDDSNARAHMQLGALYSCGVPGAPFDLTRARQELERALALNRAITGPQERLGEIALLQGDLTAAASHLNAARQTNERSVTAHYLSGYLYWQAGRVEAATTVLGEAISAAGGGRADASASAEGQTRLGFRPLLEAGQEGPLAPLWKEQLAAIGQVTEAIAQAEYERFHQATDFLRRRLATLAPPRPESPKPRTPNNEDG